MMCAGIRRERPPVRALRVPSIQRYPRIRTAFLAELSSEVLFTSELGRAETRREGWIVMSFTNAAKVRLPCNGSVEGNG